MLARLTHTAIKGRFCEPEKVERAKSHGQDSGPTLERHSHRVFTLFGSAFGQHTRTICVHCPNYYFQRSSRHYQLAMQVLKATD
jgi:hypothetical protein